MSSELRTMDEVITALGGGDPAVGRAKLIRITNSNTQKVTNWRSEGRFPAWTWLVICTALARTGHSMHPDVCGQMPPGGKRKKGARTARNAKRAVVS